MNVTQIGNSAVISAVGQDGRLQYYWQTIGSGGWNPEQLPAGGNLPSVFNSTSVAQVGNKSVIAAVGKDGSLWSFEQTIGAPATDWVPERVAPLSYVSQSASVSQVGNSSVIASSNGNNNEVLFYWQTIGKANWSPPETLPLKVRAAGGTTASVAQVGNNSTGSSVIALVGTDGSLWFYYQTIGAGNWIGQRVALPGTISTRSSPSITQVGNSSTGSSVIAAVGQDGSLWFYYQTIGAPATDWVPEQVALPGTISTTSSPSVAQVGNNSTGSSVIAAVDHNGRLLYCWQTIGSGGWNLEQAPIWRHTPLGYFISASVAQVGNAQGVSSVIAAGPKDGSLWFYWQAGQPNVGGPWNPEQVAPPGSIIADE
jgi:hypothetical protein